MSTTNVEEKKTWIEICK